VIDEHGCRNRDRPCHCLRLLDPTRDADEHHPPRLRARQRVRCSSSRPRSRSRLTPHGQSGPVRIAARAYTHPATSLPSGALSLLPRRSLGHESKAAESEVRAVDARHPRVEFSMRARRWHDGRRRRAGHDVRTLRISRHPS
jgi:hypothetical protein